MSGKYEPGTVVTDPTLYGDLAGTATAAVVVALNGIGISGTPPQANYVLQYDDVNLMWTPKALPSSNPTLGGDLSGVASSGTVVKLRGYALSTSVPTSGQLMGLQRRQLGACGGSYVQSVLRGRHDRFGECDCGSQDPGNPGEQCAAAGTARS